MTNTPDPDLTNLKPHNFNHMLDTMMNGMLMNHMISNDNMLSFGSIIKLFIMFCIQDIRETIIKVLSKIKDWIVVYNVQESSSSQGSAGAGISGAKVKLSKNGRIKYRTTTDSTGAFVLGKVKAGEYTLKISKKGYKRHTQTYQMNQSNVASLEITLDKKQ